MNDQVVVDASLAVKWVLHEDFTTEARQLLGDWDARNVVRVVPSWFACEVANVLFKRLRVGSLTLPDAQVGVAALLSKTTIQDIEPAVSIRGLEIAVSLARPASYDCHYVALAERLACELWTADERFWIAANPSFPSVRWIGELAQGQTTSSRSSGLGQRERGRPGRDPACPVVRDPSKRVR